LREKLRLTAYINFIQMVYVVDSESKERLQGALSLRDMLVADGEATLGEVMNPYLFTLLPTEEAKAAARRIVGSGLPAIPVIGDEGRILGVVTIDTALSTLLPERTRRPVLRLFS
jgi:magnesium transporter